MPEGTLSKRRSDGAIKSGGTASQPSLAASFRKEGFKRVVAMYEFATEITKSVDYERYLYKCLVPIPPRPYSPRREYLEEAIPKGLKKKLLLFAGEVVGQIEYAPAEVSGYPITGSDLIVMNCIWVLRKAKGHNLGRKLMEDMVLSAPEASGFATIALEGHWSPWFKKEQLEKLGFQPIEAITVRHKAKHREPFRIWLMWMPIKGEAKPPAWDKRRLLEGVTFCCAHPLYRPRAWEGILLEKL